MSTSDHGSPLSVEAASALVAGNIRRRKIKEAARSYGITEDEMALKADSYIPSSNGGHTLPISDGEHAVFDPTKPLEMVVKDGSGNVLGKVVGGAGNFTPVEESPVKGHRNPTAEHMWRGNAEALAKKAAAEAELNDPLGSLRGLNKKKEPEKPAAPETRVLVLIGIPNTKMQARMVASKAFLSEDKRFLVLGFTEKPDLQGVPLQTELTAHLQPYSAAEPVTIPVQNFNITFQDPESGMHYVNFPIVYREEDHDQIMPEEPGDAEKWTHGWESDEIGQPSLF